MPVRTTNFDTLLDGVMPSQVKNNGVSAAMKYKDDGRALRT